MIRLQRILCPTDLSPQSDEALRYAVALARAYDAKLFVAYCVGKGLHADFAGGEDRARPTSCGDVQGVFDESLAEFLDADALSSLSWEGIYVEADDVGEAVVREAAERGADLIVMRSRRRPRAAALLGSTAEVVCRDAPCPVLVTHPHERVWVDESNSIGLRRVLVAYDFSTDSELALRYGLSLAQEYQSELHLLHVVSNSLLQELDGALNGGAEGFYRRAAERLRNAVPAEAHLWCKVLPSVRWGKPYREVLAYASEREVDLICMGAHGAGFGMSALFGSNVDRVLRQSPCPVFVARPLRPKMPTLREAEEQTLARA